MTTIAILGRTLQTANYEKALQMLNIPSITTLSISGIADCRGLLLPGGGDITPAFFGQKNAGSQNIDTELDILQIKALEYAVRTHMPVLGICKGMQIINVFFGGTIVQHMPQADSHTCHKGDRFHETTISPDNPLFSLYGSAVTVNSAHHQCIDKPGRDLKVIQRAADHTPEAVFHETLPILGVQWHPERLMPFMPTPLTLAAGTDGRLLLSYFVSLLP